MSKDILENEKELLELTAQGCESAFTQLFTHHRDRVYSIAFKLTKSNAIAGEIVQDVFLKIWLMRAGLDGIQNFNSYLFVVARNISYKALKKIARDYRMALQSSDDLSLVTNDTADLLIEKEYSLLLQHAIDRLPNQQKEVYTLVKKQGLKRNEVACQLHIQPETVKFHLAQAMKNIRDFCLFHLDMFIGFTIFLFCSLRNN